MKKKLLQIKKYILNFRKVYNSQREIVVNMLESDLSDFIKTDNGQEIMKKLQAEDEAGLKSIIITLCVKLGIFTIPEALNLQKNVNKGPKKKLVQENFPTL